MNRFVLALVMAGCTAQTSTDSSALTTSDAWPQFGYSVSHTQYNPNETAITSSTVSGLHLAWTATTGLAPGDPSVAGGRVYVGSVNNTLYAFNAVTGHRVWRAFASRDVKSTPADAFGIVAFTADDGILYVVDARTGTPLWTADINDPRYPADPLYAFDSSHGSPVIFNGMIYVAGLSKLFAFDVHGCGAATCTASWSADIPTRVDRSTSQVVVGSNKVFVVGNSPGNEDVVFAFAAAGCGASTCQPVWTYDFGGTQISAMVVTGSRLYVQNESVFLSIRTTTGERFGTDWGQFVGDRDGWPAVGDGLWFVTGRYAGTYDGLQAFDATVLDSRPVWRTAAEYTRTPVVVNDVVFVLEGNPEVLTAYSVTCGTGGATCAPLWRDTAPVGSLDVESTGTARPIVAGGMVFIGDRQTNTLRALTL